MALKFNITKKITVNGKTYDRLEDLPPELRRTVEQALQTTPAAHGAVSVTTETKIVFNGQEYPSVDAMPPDTRRLYETAMSAVRGVSSGATFNLGFGPASKTDASSHTVLRGPRLQLTVSASDPTWLKAVKIGWILLVLLALLYLLVRHLAAP